MNYEYNDYELIYLIKEENEEAVELMLGKYEPIIKSMASYYVNHCGKVRLDYEDLLQEGRLGLIQAIRSFNEERNALFYTFAVLCIKSKMINHIKSCQTSKNYPLLSSYSLDEVIIKTVADANSDIEKSLDIKYLQDQIIKFKHDLDYEDSLIFELKFNAFSYKEISVLLDINIKRVDNRLMSIRKKFKKYLLTC